MKEKKTLIANYFKPSMYVRTFKDVSINSLKTHGIKLFIADLDNTLVPHYKRLPTKDVLEFIAEVRRYGLTFIIISNNVNRRVQTFADRAGVEYFISNAKKPFKKEVRKVFSDFNVSPRETVFMGDQVIMDILVANRLNMESILVQPLVSTDYKMNKFNIFLEKSIYRKLEKRNLLKRGEFSAGDLGVSFELL